MIYAPWNEFCMIWVIFWMPTDQVMAFLCFIFDNQSVDMSGQVWGGGRGGHNWKKQVCLKMVFRQFQVFLAHFFFYWKIDPCWPPPPPLIGIFQYFFFFFFETFPKGRVQKKKIYLWKIPYRVLKPPPPGYGKKNFIFFSETKPFFEKFL